MNQQTAMWLEALKTEVANSSNGKVASNLGVSKTVISQVCNNKYPGDMQRIRQLVEGAYLNQTVICPVMGELPVHRCMQHQVRKQLSSNPLYIQLYKSCRSGCTHSQLSDKLKRPIKLENRGESQLNAFDSEGAKRRLTLQANGNKDELFKLLGDALDSLAIKYNKLIKEHKNDH